MALKVGEPPQAPPQEPPPAGIDLAALVMQIKDAIMPEMDKRVNALDKRLKLLVKEGEPKPGEPPTPGEPPPSEPNPKLSPEVNAELAGMKREIATLKTANAQAVAEKDQERKSRLETERITAIRDALNNLNFRSQPHRDLFFKATNGDIKRTEDGKFIAETDAGELPMAEYLKNLAENNYPDMLAAKSTGGAGAHASNATRKSSGGPVKMSDITPDRVNKLSPEELAAYTQKILSGDIVP